MIRFLPLEPLNQYGEFRAQLWVSNICYWDIACWWKDLLHGLPDVLAMLASPHDDSPFPFSHPNDVWPRLPGLSEDEDDAVYKWADRHYLRVSGFDLPPLCLVRRGNKGLVFTKSGVYETIYEDLIKDLTVIEQGLASIYKQRVI